MEREEWLGDNRWGRMFLRGLQTGWTFLCYCYELPWRENEQGRSWSFVSRIRIGVYTMKVRTDGPKGWRLELEDTGHRSLIQVHRPAANVFIQGCILPVHFRPTNPKVRPDANLEITLKSVELMKTIRHRYESLQKVDTGKPQILISGTLPARSDHVRTA